MSKKSKKGNFTKIDIEWNDNETSLPTRAEAIPARGGYGSRGRGGYGGGGYGNRNDSYSNNRDGPSESDTGKWRRGPTSNSMSSNSFGGGGASGPSNNRSSYNFRSNNNSAMDEASGPSADPMASDNDRNWRSGKKREPPKISLNSTIPSTNNANPWRNNNNDTDSGPSRAAFGSRSIDRDSNGSRTPQSTPGGNRYSSGPPRFGSNAAPAFGSSPSARFGGGGPSKFSFGGGGAASKSKFNTGSSGFAAVAMQSIGSGTPRLTYNKNSRFSGILDEPVATKQREEVSLKAPTKVANSRFGGLEQQQQQREQQAPKPRVSNTMKEPERTAYPGLGPATGAPQREVETVEQLQQKIRRENLEAQREAEKNMPKKQKNTQKQTKNSKANKNAKSTAQNKKISKKQIEANKENLKKENIKKAEIAAQQKAKIDKKLVRKFNKCMSQKQSIEVDRDTERLLLFGLTQKDNPLKREEDNYEKIANLVVNVVLNPQNQLSKNEKIDLDRIYDIIYNKSDLFAAEAQCLALVLEIASLMEIRKTCLGVVYSMDENDLLNKYLVNTPNIGSQSTMKEFDEYGLQYIYPLSNDIIASIQSMIDAQQSLDAFVVFLKELRSKQMIFTNYKTMRSVLSYVLKTFYFSQCDADEEKNEVIAKTFILSNAKNKEKTQFAQLIELLRCKQDEDKDDKDSDDGEEDEEEEDDDDEVDSHSVLILSTIITCSGSLDNNNNGLVSLLKIMELGRLIKYRAIRKFQQCHDDKYTERRLDALRKLTDFISDLDARQARIAMEKDNEMDDEDDVDNEYAGNLLAPRTHKTAADYEQISYIDVE